MLQKIKKNFLSIWHVFPHKSLPTIVCKFFFSRFCSSTEVNFNHKLLCFEGDKPLYAYILFDTINTNDGYIWLPYMVPSLNELNHNPHEKEKNLWNSKNDGFMYTSKWKWWAICRNLHEQIGCATLSELKVPNNYKNMGTRVNHFIKNKSKQFKPFIVNPCSREGSYLGRAHLASLQMERFVHMGHNICRASWTNPCN